MDHARAKESTGKLEPKSCWGCLITLLVLGTIVFIISKQFSPSDWVEVTVGPLPEGYLNFCLIAEDSGGVGTLHWYHSKVFTFTEDPFMNGRMDGGFWDFDNDGFIPASVQWREAKRYGVLIQRRDHQWRLWWLEPGEISRPSFMRFVVGNGKAEIHLPAEARAQEPSQEFLKRLGYSP